VVNHDDKQTWLASGLGVVLAFCLLNFDFLSLRYLFKWDAWDLLWPMFDCLSESLKQGRIPLWDPRPCCGVPFHADPLTGTFYPVGVLVGSIFGGGYRVYQYFWLMHWLVAILGFFFLAKQMGMSPAGAAVGSLLFGFSGFFVGGAQHTICVVSVAYVVWVLLLLDRAIERHILYALPAGAFFGFAGLGGYPGLTIYSGLAVVAWTLLRHRPTMKAVAALGVTFLIGLVVLSPVYASFAVECKGYTDRVGLLTVREATNYNRFPFEAIVSLVTPAITVTYPSLFDVSPGEAPLLNGYFGIFGVLSLCVVVLDDEFRKRWAWMLWFMLLVFLFVLGSAGGIAVIGYYVFPPLGFVRQTSLARVFWMLGGGILAAYIFDRFTSSGQAERSELVSRACKVLAGLLYVTFCALTAAWIIPTEGIQYGFPDTIAPVANGFPVALECVGPQAVLIVLFAAVLWLIRTSISRPAIVGAMLMLVVLDVGNHLHSNKQMMGSDGQATDLAAALQSLGSSTRGQALDPRNKNANPPVVNQNIWVFDGKSYVRSYLGVKSANYDFLVGSSWPPYEDTKFLHVLENSPGFWLVPSAHYCSEDDKDALARLRDTEAGTALPVFIHDPAQVDAALTAEAVKPGTFGAVKIVRYDYERVELLVDAPRDCWLFATERYAPGWKAYANDRQIPLYKSDFCFRACRVPAGIHTIRMEYSPWIYKPLIAASWGLSFLILAGWPVAALVARGRKTHTRRITSDDSPQT
jgi:hypothetical protein